MSWCILEKCSHSPLLAYSEDLAPCAFGFSEMVDIVPSLGNVLSLIFLFTGAFIHGGWAL